MDLSRPCCITLHGSEVFMGLAVKINTAVPPEQCLRTVGALFRIHISMQDTVQIDTANIDPWQSVLRLENYDGLVKTNDLSGSPVTAVVPLWLVVKGMCIICEFPFVAIPGHRE